MDALLIALEQLNRTRREHKAACEAVWKALFAAYPEIVAVLEEWDLPQKAAGPWFCEPQFDGKSAAELFVEGNGAEVLLRIRQLAHGVYR